MTKHIVTAHFKHEDGTEVTVTGDTTEGGFSAVDTAIELLKTDRFFHAGQHLTERHVLDEWQLLTLVAMRVEL